jgi:hypothetical protein
MIFTTGLFIYHTSLITSNLTTKEELKRVYNNPYGNPFNKNFKMNIKNAFCPRTTKPTMLEKLRINIKRVKIPRKNPEKLVNNFITILNL